MRAPQPKPVQLEAKVAPPAYRSFNHLSGTVSSGRLNYEDIYAFAWWRGGDVEAPVRLELSEDTGLLFTEVRIQADYLPSRTRGFGSELTLSAEGRPEETLYHAQIRRLEKQGLIQVGGETMLSKLQDFEPETLRVRGPFTPKTALETMLRTWRREAPWLTWERVPEFFVLTGKGYAVPQLGALVLGQPEDLSASKTSAYGWLERFFKLFSEYAFRVNQAGRFALTPPRLDLEKDLYLGDNASPFELLRQAAGATTPNGDHHSQHFGWGAKRVKLWLEVYEQGGRFVTAYNGASLGAHAENLYHSPEGYTVVVTLFEDAFGIDVFGNAQGRFFVRGHVEVTEPSETQDVKRLQSADVGFDLTETTDIDGVVNRCSVSSQGYEFVFEQELLEPAYAFYAEDNAAPYAEPYRPGEERKEVTSVWSAPEGTLIGSDTLQAAVNIEVYDENGPFKQFGIDKTLPKGEAQHVRAYVSEGFPTSRTYELSFYLLFTGTQVNLFGVKHTPGVGHYQGQPFDSPSAWIVKLNAAGEKFARSEEKVFGYHDESQGSPYGIQHERIDAGPFPISYEVAQAIAVRRVAQAKEPKTIVSFEQSPRLPVLPDDLGSVLELPDGRRGTVTSFAYAEAHTPQGSLSRSSVKVRLGGES